MQTLGLSDSTPKPENRLKALLWPTIRQQYDADYICQQGFWICFALGVMTLLFALISGAVLTPLVSFAAGLIFALYYFLGGVGIRQGSIFAAVAVFVNYLLANLTSIGILNILWLALLLANVRATWLAARWRATSTEPPPMRMNQTLGDKLSDSLPERIWPAAAFLFYPLALVLFGLLLVALLRPALLVRPH
jgi:hypothetical protein